MTSDPAGIPAHGIRPIRDQVIVLQDRPREQLPGSVLYVPDQCARELQEDYCTVLAVGPDVDDEIRPGRRYLFKRRACSALIPDKREGGPAEWADVLVLRAEDFLCELED